MDVSTAREPVVGGGSATGRPKRRWTEDIKEWSNQSVTDCIRTAQDRRAWWGLVESSLMNEDGPRQDKLSLRVQDCHCITACDCTAAFYRDTM